MNRLTSTLEGVGGYREQEGYQLEGHRQLQRVAGVEVAVVEGIPLGQVRQLKA